MGNILLLKQKYFLWGNFKTRTGQRQQTFNGACAEYRANLKVVPKVYQCAQFHPFITKFTIRPFFWLLSARLVAILFLPNRIQAITNLSKDIIWSSENLQVSM